MATDRTLVTELGTALGTLPHPDLATALHARSPVLHVDAATWDRLAQLHRLATFRQDFASAYGNGKAFAAAADGLAGRPPRLVEWTGGRRPPGDEVAPIDLRIDHVYLISCKYLSANVANASPARLFDGLLATSGTWDRTDWYQVVAPDEYQELYAACRSAVLADARRGEGGNGSGTAPEVAEPEVAEPEVAEPEEGVGARKAGGLGHPGDRPGGTAGGRAADLPFLVTDLTPADRDRLRRAPALRGRRYPDGAREPYRKLCAAVSTRSAARWRERLGELDPERMLWRLLRIGNAPYFLLGADGTSSLRCRIDTPWDWHHAYRLDDLTVSAADAGQPRVDWSARYVVRSTGMERTVRGHVEIRWGHGRFGQPPEAKVYLDTPVDRLPGYHPIGQVIEESQGRFPGT